MVEKQHRILTQKEELDKETQFRHLFTITLEVVFSLIKANSDIEGLQFLVILSYTLFMKKTLSFLKKREISN